MSQKYLVLVAFKDLRYVPKLDLRAGTTVDLDDATANHVQRNTVGRGLRLATEARAMNQPRQDRMVRHAPTRAHDSQPKEEPIDRKVYKATKHDKPTR